MDREQIERDLGWVLHLGKENTPATLELVDRLAGHCRNLMDEVGRLQHLVDVFRVMRRVTTPTPEDVGRCQRDSLEMLVRIAWEYVEISTGRAAEILNLDLVTMREKINTEGWKYRDEEESATEGE